MEKKHIDDVKYLEIKLVSPDKIINEWSNGEVYNQETLNYRTLKPEFGGLFCEKIFGPMKDYECACGKYKKSTYRGKRCEKCGVDVVSSKVRRQRKGHIELESPVVSPLFKKYITTLMGDRVRQNHMDMLINYRAYIITKVESGLKNKDIKAGLIFAKDDVETRDQLERMNNEFKRERNTNKNGIEYELGTIGLLEFLKHYDIDGEIKKVKSEISKLKKTIRKDIENGSSRKYEDKFTRLNDQNELLMNFKTSGNRPEWLVMTVIPVIPADLRPLTQLGSGRNVVSGINELYRKVIMRNNRLKEMQKVGSPMLLLNDERVSLQNAVNDLFDNSKNNENINSGNKNKKIHKSLVEQLKGKQGRFRQNLLGKRVDFSGRSVIVVGPNLNLDECGLPKEMALELFKPLVIGALLSKQKAPNIPAAKRKIEARDEDVWEQLEEVVSTHKVLLNRAPTLHRLGIQAFKPKLVEGKAIRLSPLVCAAYNADFDGDQMAVHLPLSKKAQIEASELMLASKNVLNPKDGQPIVAPSQDMILGNYYLTLEEKNENYHVFKDTKEAMMAYENRLITLHERIFIDAKEVTTSKLADGDVSDKLLFTTIGKFLFNQITPLDYPYVNAPTAANLVALPDEFLIKKGTDLGKLLMETEPTKPFKKSDLSNIISSIFERYTVAQTAEMLDKMKALGFKYSCLSGISISYTDVPSVDKADALNETQEEVNSWNELYRNGLVSDDERYQKITQDLWPTVRDQITNKLLDELEQTNNIYMMSDSGARGNRSNFTQLGAMRGLMAAPNGKIIELPVKSSFNEGLTVLEYFISSHGARKGLADTALKTADSGYLTRRLVDVAQDVVVTEEDCNTYDYDIISDMKEGNEVIVPMKERIIGRTIQESVSDAEGVIVHAGEMITETQADRIVAAEIESVKIRTVFSCKTHNGVCRKCYGRDLATNQMINIGEAIGIVAAQSIGEPGTQLTMRTFHTGGVAGADITQGLPRVVELFEAGLPHGKAVLARESGEIKITEKAATLEVQILNAAGREIDTYSIPHGIKIRKQNGETIKRGEVLTEGSIHPKELLELCGVNRVREYILKEIQKVYRLQGVGINDKHVEIIVSQMMKYVRVVDAGNTRLIPGEYKREYEVAKLNKEKISKGKRVATVIPTIMGIKKASLETESFLSAASFQETAKTLSNATIRGKRDYLRGIKENVIVGKKIPAGTGKTEHYKGINFDTEK